MVTRAVVAYARKVVTNRHYVARRRQAAPTDKGVKRPLSLVVEARSPTLASPEPQAPTHPDASEYRDSDEIWNFLASCRPTMTHHYYAFVEHGCIDAKYLKAFHGWPEDRLRGYIDRFSDAYPGRITRTDCEIIIHHLMLGDNTNAAHP